MINYAVDGRDQGLIRDVAVIERQLTHFSYVSANQVPAPVEAESRPHQFVDSVINHYRSRSDIKRRE